MSTSVAFKHRRAISAQGGRCNSSSGSHSNTLVSKNEQLWTLCNELLAERADASAGPTGDDCSQRSERTGALRRKFRIAVRAVMFANSLVRLRLPDLAKNMDGHRCEPYTIFLIGTNDG